MAKRNKEKNTKKTADQKQDASAESFMSAEEQALFIAQKRKSWRNLIVASILMIGMLVGIALYIQNSMPDAAGLSHLAWSFTYIAAIGVVILIVSRKKFNG